MKFYKNENNEVYAFPSDGSGDTYIKPGLTKITESEADELRKLPPPTLDESKTSKLLEISATCDAILNESIADYPASKIQTFSPQTAQAYVSSSPGMETEKDAILMRKDLTVPGISETSKWEEDIYEIQTTDIVFGGPDGISNRQAKQLANRTCFLKNKQDTHADSENPHSQYLLKTESVLQQQQLAGEMQHLLEGSLEDHTHSEDPHPQYISLPKNTADGMAVVFREGKGWGAEFIPGVPIGTIEYFAMAKPPPGYLKADGAAIGRLTYPGLFAAIGTTFGAGDGSATFNLPDLRGEFIRGWDNGRNVDAGRVFGSAQGDAMRNMKGVVCNSYDGTFSGPFYVSSTPFPSVGLDRGNAHVRTVSFDASRVVPTADENRPSNVALLACIKAFDAAVNPELIDIAELAQEVANKVPYADFIGNNKLLQENGYQKLPGGMILQWGITPIAQPHVLSTITLPTAFPTLHASTVITAISGGGTQSHDLVTVLTLENFGLWNSSATAASFRFISIGF